MTILRVGATQKYVDGWDKAFGKSGKKAKPAASKKRAAKSAKKKSKSR